MQTGTNRITPFWRAGAKCPPQAVACNVFSLGVEANQTKLTTGASHVPESKGLSSVLPFPVPLLA